MIEFLFGKDFFEPAEHSHTSNNLLQLYDLLTSFFLGQFEIIEFFYYSGIIVSIP